MEKTSFFGIDFGTTSSAVVEIYLDTDGRPQTVKHGDAWDRPIPSDVAIDRATEEIYTGREAKDRRQVLSKRCVYIPSIKMKMGSDVSFPTEHKVWKPVDVAAEVFRRLKAETEGRMTQAVVAIPIDFTPEKRRMVRRAAQMAGIEITSFVSEPTAAFFANYDQLKACANVVVFDWGGGTLDVSVLHHHEGRVDELATKGLGIAGNDIDHKLAERIHAKFCQKKGMQVALEDMPPESRDLLLNKAEAAKIRFAEEDHPQVSVNRYGKLGIVRTQLDGRSFDSLIRSEIDKAMQVTMEAIADAELTETAIDAVLMVGGSSGLFAIQDAMRQKFGEDRIVLPEESMWNVGEGAARLARSGGTYHSNQEIAVKLHGGGTYAFLKPGEDITSFQRQATFALVDATQQANIVMCGSADIHDFVVKPLKTYSFLEEKVTLTATITRDLVFELRGRSNYRADSGDVLWQYNRLKFYYALPKEA